MMNDPKESTAASGSKRLVFVDQARAIAIMLMLLGHSLDRFLAEPWRSGDFYTAYQPVRGVSSTLFLMVAGFSFVIATFGHWQGYMSLTPKMWARIRRIGLILFLGYLLNLWAPTLIQSIDGITAQRWERFIRFEVLQNIGFGLAALHLIAWAAGTQKRFFKLTLGLSFAIFALAAITYRRDVDSLLPIELSTMLNLFHGSHFPVVPYTGFMLLGALFGYLYMARKRAEDEWKVFAVGIFVSLFLIGLDLVVPRIISGGVFPYWAALEKMPGNTFARAGTGILTISALYFLGRYRILLPRLSFLLSKDSLAIYFVHLFLIYSASRTQQFLGVQKQGLSLVQVAFWVAGLAVTMTAMAWTIGWLRTNRPKLLAGSRRTAILGGCIIFIALPDPSAAGIALCLASAAMIVIVLSRRRSVQAADARG